MDIKYQNIYISKIEPPAMKKLLLASLLLGTLFTFGNGKLKAHPNSPYEKQNTKLNISDPTRLNNNSQQYSLRMAVLNIPMRMHPVRPGPAFLRQTRTEMSETFFNDRASCERAIGRLRAFIDQPIYRTARLNLWVYGSCAPAEINTVSEYKIPEYYKYQFEYFESAKHSKRHPNPPKDDRFRKFTSVSVSPYLTNFTINFSNKSDCEKNAGNHRMNIARWFNYQDAGKFKKDYGHFVSRAICIKAK